MCSEYYGGLDKAALLSNNLIFRDKSIKVLQYASRVLLGWYGDSLHAATKSAASTLMFQCGQSRKAFRLLKSVNMLNTLARRGSAELFSPLVDVDSSNSPGDVTATQLQIKKYRELARRFEVLELLCMSGYYLCDNAVFLGRAAVLTHSYNARFWETITFSFWAANDVTAVVRHCLLLWALSVEELACTAAGAAAAAAAGHEATSIGTSACAIAGASADADAAKDGTGVCASAVRERTVHYEKLAALRAQRKAVIWALVKSLLDLGVSGGHSMYCYRDSAVVKTIDRCTPLYQVFVHNAPLNANIGLCGVFSSLMIIYDLL